MATFNIKYIAVVLYLSWVSLLRGGAQNSINFDWVKAISQEMSSDFRDTPVFRLPVMVICNNGDVVVVSEAKSQTNVFKFYAISCSNDCGNIFSARRSEYPMAELVYDRVNDRIFSYASNTFYASDDHGKSWYDYNSIIEIEKPDTFDVVSMVPTSGIQLKNGILAIPLRYIRYKRDSLGKKGHQTALSTVFILYSKDYGASWMATPMTPINTIADEATIVEYLDNQIMINARGGTEYFWDATNFGRRIFIPENRSKNRKSRWEIKSWSFEKESDGVLKDPICHASLIKATLSGKIIGLFCNPDMPNGIYAPRENLCLRATIDFKHWVKVCSMTPKDYPVWGYTSMSTNKKMIMFAYEDKQDGILVCDLRKANKWLINYLTNTRH